MVLSYIRIKQLVTSYKLCPLISSFLLLMRILKIMYDVIVLLCSIKSIINIIDILINYFIHL